MNIDENKMNGTQPYTHMADSYDQLQADLANE